MLPSSAELTYFFEIATVLSFSRAAEKLNASQPSLSLAIKRLEKTVGAELFIRHKQGVTLTRAGEILLQHVEGLLKKWESTQFAISSTKQDVAGRVKIGCHSSMTPLFSSLLSTLLETHPSLEIQLVNKLSHMIAEEVIDASLDIAIVIDPPLHPDLIMRKIAQIEIGFWVGSNNRNTQNIEGDEAVIICDPHMPQAAFLLKQLDKIKKKPTRISTVNTFEGIANMAINGCGIGILPACFVKRSYPNNLSYISHLPSIVNDLHLVYRKENRTVKTVQLVLSAFKQLITLSTE